MPSRVDGWVAAAITVVVSGTGSGPVRVMLYDGPDGFPTDLAAADRVAVGTLENGRATVVFDDVPAGTWAASAFLDTDGDGELDSAWFGMPKEPVGATSNGTGWGIGPPRFSGSSFAVGDGPVEVHVTLVDL